ncbi:YutD-like domain-containing protein [Streptococcus sp. NLN64]|uniref:YutD family protein n=1 Tax=Streptococcus sp. NLN64 TaxID=2822799 RepID=UPI0018CA7405|nr:YutD-like domain-containing protein [Streptococcus sp. NLN64]MBG9367279.1 DUF1027 domain-containing protein [Streptococcus sp. NLN64]
MRKVIDPELYNYNRFPGPQFTRQGDRIEAEEVIFTLLTDYGEAFDPVSFSQRFSNLLLKFDYIVGDWSNEQLRLKGFYRDKRAEHTWSKISRLDEYLLEYCSFGAAYFVLENAHPIYPNKNQKRKRDSRHKEGRKQKRVSWRKATVAYKPSVSRNFSIRKKQERG